MDDQQPWTDTGYESEEQVDDLLPEWDEEEQVRARERQWEWTRARSMTPGASSWDYAPRVPTRAGTPLATPRTPNNESEESQCRICFGGVEDQVDCGRLISPCLCSGSMRYVHVGCIQQWRGTGRNKKAFMECTQCGFRYRLRRTRILGLASSKPILFVTSVFIFLTLALLVGSILHWMLHFKGFRRIITGPYGDNLGFDRSATPDEQGIHLLERLQNGENVPWEEAFRQDPIGAGVVRLGLPGGLVYVSSGSGIFELVVKSIRAFINGEAEGVMQGLRGIVDMCLAWLGQRPTVQSLVRFLRPLHLDAIRTLHIPGSTYLAPLLTRFTLGFSLIGSASFVTLLITHSMMAPFHILNNIRLGRGAGPFGLPVRTRTRDARGGGGGMAMAGVGSAVLVLFVVAGAVRAVQQLYALTNAYSFILLSKAENAILEVNPKGEVIPDQPGGLGSGIITTDGTVAVVAE